MKKKVYIDGMSCEHCVKRVEKALLALPGVESVQVNLDGKSADITAGEFPTDEAIKTAVTEAGYQVTGIE